MQQIKLRFDLRLTEARTQQPAAQMGGCVLPVRLVWRGRTQPKVDPTKPHEGTV